MGDGKGKKKLGREPDHKRLLKTENNLRVDGGWEMGIEEGTCWGRALGVVWKPI